MSRSSKSPQKTSFNQHLILIAFCVIAGFAVTACQPKLMQNLSPGETPTPNVLETPMPTGVPVTNTEPTPTPTPTSAAAGKKSAAANAEIDASLKANDSLLNSGSPDDVSGSDLN